MRKIAARARKRRPCYRILFTGPNRTAKLLAAQVVADELQLPLYLSDLSAVINKYIGETEKNLRKIFDAAESAEAILFFDEADALVGKRTAVKDAHDRYANIGIASLLDWIDDFSGVVLVSIKRNQNFGPAFLCRFQSTIAFPSRIKVRPAKSRKRTRPAARKL